MPRPDRGALIACEGFRKRSANAIEFGGFTQHDEHPFVGTKMAESGCARFDQTGISRRHAPASVERGLVRANAERLQLTLDLRECARQLLPARGMCRGLKLTANFGVGQS
jgi:hypothetical protein